MRTFAQFSDLYKMRLFFYFLLPLLISCSSADPKAPVTDSVAVDPAAPKPGTISDYSCANDGSNVYSVYLPQKYDAAKQWPVIIFFDAHGNGHLPLGKYKSVADKWGFVLIGSNSSKNGMPGNETVRIGNGLVDEVKRVLPVDGNEIMLCGFSGGARVAAAVAAGRNDLKGVICNSAAPQAPLNGKIFIGEAGLGDMNYLEMRKFVNGQTTNQYPHELLVFDGKHEWAPVSVFEDALLISRSYYISGASIGIDTASSDALAPLLLAQADSIKKISCSLAEQMLATAARTCSVLTGAADNATAVLPAVAKAQAAISKDPCVAKDEAAWKKAEEKETAMQQFLSDALLTHDTTWWEEHQAEYFETKETGAEKFMRDRLRGYVSLMCYTYSNQAFHIQNLHAAEKMTKVYSIVDPTNSEWAYMRAMLYVQLGMNEYVLPNLQKAVELGFNDKARLQNDPGFAALHSDPAFNALFGAMKQE